MGKGGVGLKRAFGKNKLGGFFRYTLHSLFCTAVDEGVFMLVSWLLRDSLQGLALTAVPTVCARAVSSFMNFNLNRKLVFPGSAPWGVALLRFYALALPILAAQLGLTHCVCLLFSIGSEQTLLRGVIYAAVMTVLFIVNYLCQRFWVFSKQ